MSDPTPAPSRFQVVATHPLPRPSARHAISGTGCIAALLVLSACTTDPVSTPLAPDDASIAVVRAPLPALIEEPRMLATPTYDGSGESVHPDVVEFEHPWRGSRFWMAMTPYPKSDYKLENPSLLVSDDGVRLQVPDGLVNPVVARQGKRTDYNSDPDLVYEASTDRLVMVYRYVQKRTNSVRVVSSRDGRTWSAEPQAFWAHGHTAVSPTVTAPRAGGRVPAKMWYVDAGRDGCKTSGSRVLKRIALDTTGRVAGVRWSEPVPTDLAQPGYVVWHLKVRYVPSKGEYWALYAAFPKDRVGCDTDDLFFARSVDGVHWESFPEPLLRHEDRAWTAAAVYRSTFLYDPVSDELRVWLSARGVDAKWHLGLARFRYARVLETLEDAAARRARVAVGPIIRVASWSEAP